VIDKALFKAQLQVADVDWLILHQANQRIMDAVAERLGLPPEKIVSNVAEYGNTSAASIPIALNAAVRSGKIKPGDTIATSGFGAGLSWGAAILRWG
jgi:3-oxoacyl-[acyl-carrier-protein] synthase III